MDQALKPETRFKTFQEFWPFYLREHSLPANRRIHFVGTSLAILVFSFAIFTANFVLLFAVPIAGYAFAWFGHFVIEKNRPATFKYPGWSLRGDFTMFFYALTGQLGAELRRHGI